MSFNKDPVQGLIDYISDIKPYHTKIMDVLIEYVYSDSLKVSITDSIKFDIGLDFDVPPIYGCPDGFDTYGFGTLTDPLNPNPFIDPMDPESPYQQFSIGENGSIIITSGFGTGEACDPQSETFIYASISEQLELSHGTTLWFADQLTTMIQEPTMGNVWDSRLSAFDITKINHQNNSISIKGRHDSIQNGTVISNALGFTGHKFAVHGTENNNGIYTTVSSVYDPIEHETHIFVSENVDVPRAYIDGYQGRAVDSESIFYDPIVGYLTPFPYVPGVRPISNFGFDGISGFDTLGGTKTGARIQRSYDFTSNPSTNIFTSSSPLPFNTNDEVYLASNGTLPFVEYTGTNKQYLLAQYQPYYFIKLSNTTFQLAMAPNFPALDVITEGSSINFIGIGEKIAFMEIAMGQLDDIDLTMSDQVSISNELLSSPDDFEIVNVDIPSSILFVSGDVTQSIIPGMIISVHSSMGGANDGQHSVVNVTFDDQTNQTSIYIAGFMPVNITPLGLISNRKTSGNLVTETTFQERIDFHVNSISFVDSISIQIIDTTSNNVSNIPSLFGGGFGVGFFNVGGYGF